MLILVWLQFTVTIEPSGSTSGLLPDKAALGSAQSVDTTEISSSAEATSQAKPLKLTAQATPQVTAIPGALRISNQTSQPLRVALLYKQKAAYGEPVHWDFAPGEGSSQGLLVSLPEGNLKLKKGDVIVAFAQDGSRRYWGPYVVGETEAPVLNQTTSEWQLILQP